MTTLAQSRQRDVLVLTASNEAADERLVRGERSESLFAFKRRLQNALDPSAATNARVVRFVRACILGEGLEGAHLSARAKTTTILRELNALESSEDAPDTPVMGYAALVREALRARPDRFATSKDLPSLVAAADPRTIRTLTADLVIVRAHYAFTPEDLALFERLSESLVRASADLVVEVPGSSQQRLDFTEHDPFAPLADMVAKALKEPPSFVEPRGTLGNASTAASEGRITCLGTRDEWSASELAVSRVLALLQGARGVKVALSDVCLVVSDLAGPALPPLLTLLAQAGIPARDPRGFERDQAEVLWAAIALAELAVASTPRELSELFMSSAIDIGLGAKDRRALASRLRASSRVEVPDLVTAVGSLAPVLGPERTEALIEAISAVSSARSRRAAADALVALWMAFGLPQAADRGATSPLRRDAPTDSIERTELYVLAREGAYVRALLDAVASYRTVLDQIGEAESPAGAPKVAHEVMALLPGRMAPLPAARAGVLRVAAFEEAVALSAPFPIVVDAARDAARSTFDTKPWVFSAQVWGLINEAKHVTFIVPTFLGGAETHAWDEIADASLDRAPAESTGESSTPPDVAARVALEAERERYFLSPKRVASQTVGKLPEGTILGAYVGAGARPIPVTTLESFAACAFRGYAEHVLSARDKPAETLTMDARKEGALLHELCALVFERTRELWAKRPRPAEAIFGALDEVVAEQLRLAQEGSLRSVELRYAAFVARQVILGSLLDEEWDYALAEQPFGSSGTDSWPALPLGVEDATIGGRIDRIDVGRDRKSYRVIDYKRGKQEDRLVGVTSLQLPLYAEVVNAKTHLPVLEGVYWRLVGKDSGPKQVSAKVWSHARENARQSAAETFRHARAGNIEPSPHLPTFCQTCSVSGVCRRPPFAIPELEGDG